MIRRSISWLIAVAVISLALAACDPDTEPTPTSSGPTGAPTGTESGSSAPDGPDPNVPYSPRPSELAPRTTGFVTETLTLPITEDARMLVTVDSTALRREYQDSYRPLSVWVTFENPGDEPWTGVPAEDARISDEAGAVFEPIPNPPAGDLHPDPDAYGASNRDLTQRTTIAPGGSIRGVIVFHPTGGNRFITIAVSMDGGNVWGEWSTTMGPF